MPGRTLDGPLWVEPTWLDRGAETPPPQLARGDILQIDAASRACGSLRFTMRNHGMRHRRHINRFILEGVDMAHATLAGSGMPGMGTRNASPMSMLGGMLGGGQAAKKLEEKLPEPVNILKGIFGR